MKNKISSLFSKVGRCLRTGALWAVRKFVAYWRKNWWHKTLVVLLGLIILAIGAMYGIARWYIASQSSKPLTVGTTFIADYASSLGLDPHQTMQALTNDMHVKHFRLVSYWSDIEKSEGTYDFSELDWEFQQAEQAHATVSLSIGLRQPRWPECHLPTWAENEPANQWTPQLNQFITTVVNRYKNSPALDSYQLENEYFLAAFGTCTDFSRDRLVNEYNLVKKTDPQHIVIVSRSNNALGIGINDPRPDKYGVSIYKRVWTPVLHRYIEYPFPAWYYGFLAGLQKIATGRDMIIHELQAEAWPPDGQSITQTSVPELNKSIDTQRLKDRIQYGKATGMRTMYLWGSEYWYYLKEVKHDPALWDTAKQAF